MAETADNYYERYLGYLQAEAETSLATVAAEQLLTNFPHQLSEPQRSRIKETLASLPYIVPRKSSVESSADNDEKHHADVYDEDLPYIWPLFLERLVLRWSGREVPTDYTMLVYPQYLAMTIAHLEAFVGDSLQTICRVRPEILKCNRSISWKAVVESPDRDALLQALTEAYCYELGQKSICLKLEYLREKHGVSGEYSSADLELIEEAELLRNLILHNGSRVSLEYLRRTKQSGLRVGERVQVSLPFAQDLGEAAMRLAGNLYIAVSSKFFPGQSRPGVVVLPEAGKSKMPVRARA